MSSALPSLVELVSPRTLQRLQDNFAEALGISAAILDLNGDPLTQGRFNSDFLATRCAATRHEFMKAVELRKTHIYECQSGVFSFAAPIMVDGRPIGIIKGGQVRLGNPDLKLCKHRAEALNVTFDEFLEAFLSLPLFTRERLEASADLLRMVASTISTMAYAGLSAEEEIQQVTYINDLLEAEVKRKTVYLERANARYRTLFENAEDVIYTVDTKGIITSINPSVSRMTGYEPTEVIGRHFSEFLYSEDIKAVENSFGDILKGTKAGTSALEFRLSHKKGGVRWVELNSRAICNASGQLLEIEGILRDITLAHEYVENIEASEKKYRLLFENSSKPTVLFNRQGICLNVNKAMASFLGYDSSKDMEGRAVLDFIPSEFHDDYERVVQSKIMGKERSWENALVVLVKKNGEKVVTDVTLSNVSDDIFMGVLWHQRQRRSFLAKAISRHWQSEKLSQILKN